MGSPGPLLVKPAAPLTVADEEKSVTWYVRPARDAPDPAKKPSMMV